MEQEVFVEMINVEFMTDTLHPEHGEVKKGDVRKVTRDYMLHYQKLGLAKPTTRGVTK